LSSRIKQFTLWWWHATGPNCKYHGWNRYWESKSNHWSLWGGLFKKRNIRILRRRPEWYWQQNFWRISSC